MKLITNYHLVAFIFLIHAKHLFAGVCYECTQLLNHTITTDNLAATNNSACTIETSSTSCSVRFIWFDDGTTEVFYTSDLTPHVDSVYTLVNRRAITWSAEYQTRRYFIYTCQASNTTPCNTIENVKHSLASTIYPSDDQIGKFDALLAPTTEFFGGTCLNITNTTDCVPSNLGSCQQCVGILEYSNQTTACTMCPAGKAIANFFEYSTVYFFNTHQRTDTVKLGCRKYGPCNSVENLAKIKHTLYTQFHFSNSTDVNTNQSNPTTTTASTGADLITTTPSTGTIIQLSSIVFSMLFFVDLLH